MLRFTLAVLLAVSFPPSLKAQTPSQYTVKETEPSTGTRIRKDLTGTIGVAFNRSYAELAPEEKARVRGNYVDLPDSDEPPFPKRGLQALVKPITQAQQKLLVNGDFFVVAKVGIKGTVEEVQVYKSPSPAMTKFAAQVLMSTEFKPGLCDQRACVMEFPLAMTFSVQ